MSTINQLPLADPLQPGDNLVFYSPSNGDSRRNSLTALTAYLQENLAGPSLTTQHASPNASGFNVQVTDGNASIYLVLTPLAAYAAGTITLPQIENVIDKQELLCNTTQAVTAFTVDANGAGAVVGAPTTLAQNGFFRLRYDITNDTWYRVG